MKKIKKVLIVSLTAVFAACVSSGLAACGGNEDTGSLRTQLETVSSDSISFDFEEGTFSFTAVENATYYRVYFYNVTSPDEDLGNTGYFQSVTEEVTETYPDGQTGTTTVTTYLTDENGNYLLQDTSTILSLTPTYSRRYNAQYTDENGDKQNYEPGETVTFDLPNSSISGGDYIVGIRAGGPIALYTMSEFVTVSQTLVLHNVDPEIETDSAEFSTTFSQYGTSESEGNFGTSNNLDTTNVVLEEGMMFEITNADTFYNGGVSELRYYISYDEEGEDLVSFSFENIRMTRNDSNTFCGWIEVEDGTVDNSSVTYATASVNNYIYSHSGPTMEYQTTGWFWVYGLTEGQTYYLHIYAPGDGGVTSYDSEYVTVEFVYSIYDFGE